MCFKKQKVLVKHVIDYVIIQSHDLRSLEEAVLKFMQEESNHGIGDYWEPQGGCVMVGPGEVVSLGQALVKVTFIFKEIT